ncbi:27817_t:CDS:2, partial [Racocetra persica]
DYKTFEIVSSSDSKNYGYDKNFNLDAENFLQDKEFQELKETIVGSLFQFTFDGELVKQEESGAFLGVEEGKSYKWKKLTSSVPTQSEHLIKGDPNLSHEKISAKIRKLNPDALPEGTEWKERIEPTDLFITDISQLLEYVRLCAEAIMSLKEEIDDEERFDLEKRIKGRSLDLLEVLKTSLHLEDGKINEKLDKLKTHQEKENDNLKAAKKYVLSELEELKYFLCDDETLNKEANKIKEDIQLVEYFAIISKAIRNIRNDVNLSKVSGTVELLLLNMLNSSNADDEMLEAEISRLSPDALTDNATIESLAKKLAINDLKRLKDYKGCLKDDELNKAVNE